MAGVPMVSASPIWQLGCVGKGRDVIPGKSSDETRGFPDWVIRGHGECEVTLNLEMTIKAPAFLCFSSILKQPATCVCPLVLNMME